MDWTPVSVTVDVANYLRNPTSLSAALEAGIGISSVIGGIPGAALGVGSLAGEFAGRGFGYAWVRYRMGMSREIAREALWDTLR